MNDTSYNESFYTSSGQTETLCTTGLTKDFNITIVFDRYKRYTDCDIENMGGQNDLIIGPHPTDYIINTGVTAVTSTQVVTGYLITNPLDVLTGATPTYQYNEELNKKWADERDRRLGTLKIYLNGNLIYKLKDWEEIIPSKRGEQPFIQSWGGGTGLMGGIHEGVCCFNIKSIKYYEEPLNFVHVKHNFKTRLTDFDFEICNAPCVDDVYGLGYSSPTPTPTPTGVPTSTPTPTPTGVPTSTPTSTPTPTVLDYGCFRYSFVTGGTPGFTQYNINGNTMTISKRDYYMGLHDYSTLSNGNNFIIRQYTDYNNNYGTFTLDNTPPQLVGNNYVLSGTYIGSNIPNSTVCYVCYNVGSPAPTPTPTPTSAPTDTPTPTPTPTTTGFATGPFNFNFDYMLCEYFFSDGSDMDTMTYVSNPLIMNNDFTNGLPGDYVGTCALSANGPSNGNWTDPFLLYGGDNLGTGTEAILFDLNKFKTQYPSATDLELTFTSTWYGTPGINPVIMRATMWKKDNINLPIQDGYTFVYPESVETLMVQSNGQLITCNTQNCEAFEEVAKFQFNITSHDGQFI